MAAVFEAGMPMIHYITTNGIGNAWVANELRQVQLAGIPFRLHALRRPRSSFHLCDWAGDLDRETVAIYPLPVVGLLFSICVAPFLFRGRYFSGLLNALFGERETLRGRAVGLAHFGVACHWARRYRHDCISHIHSQWIHSGGTIAMYASWLLGVSFSFTGHAADLFRERVALRDKIRRANFIVCISSFHREFYLKEGARPEQLRTIYCGIDLDQFKPVDYSAKQANADGIRIRSSGRLVEKKGFTYLIDACRILADQNVAFECVIGGDGPLEAALKEQVSRLGLADRVRITGEMLKQEAIPSFMAGGDVYCLPCVWASDNDVDGLPQMLMEALACGLPIVSTRLVGIPDLIRHEQTGLLVDPNDAAQIAAAIVRLGRDAPLARRLAQAGGEWLRERFDLHTCLKPLIDEYRQRLGASANLNRQGRGRDCAMSAEVAR